MPDRWGRPTFNDGAAIAQGISALDDQTHKRQQRETEQQTEKAKSIFLNKPELMQQDDISGVEELSGFNEEAVNNARVDAAADYMTKRRMNIADLKADKIEAEHQATQAKKHAGMALQYYEQGEDELFFDEAVAAYEQVPDGFRPSKVKMENGEIGLVLESPRGKKSKPMTKDEVVDYIRKNPINPEEFFTLKQQSAATIREFNKEALKSPEVEYTPEGETRYRITKLRMDGSPFFVYFDKDPRKPNAKVLDTTDTEGNTIEKEWQTVEQMKAGLSGKKTQAEIESTTALADQRRATAQKTRKETALLETGQGGSDAPADVKTANYIESFLKKDPQYKGMPEHQIKKLAYQMATAKSGMTREQFIQEMTMNLVKNQFMGNIDPQEISKTVTQIADAVYPQNRGGALGGQGGGGQQVGEMPDPAQHKGRTIKDTATGKRYKSDGQQWVEVR